MSAPQPIGTAVGSGLGISTPASAVIGPGPVSTTSSIVAGPLTGQLTSGLMKNGTGLQGQEEEVAILKN